jgi:hypothetical protein
MMSGQDRYEAGLHRAALLLGGVLLLILAYLSQSCTPVRPPATEAERRIWCAQIPALRAYAEDHADDETLASGLEAQVREYEEMGKCAR